MKKKSFLLPPTPPPPLLQDGTIRTLEGDLCLGGPPAGGNASRVAAGAGAEASLTRCGRLNSSQKFVLVSY